MFADAIETVGGYTRPIMFISRKYKSNAVLGGAGTMFFVNDSGCAVTCRHMAELIGRGRQINERYREFAAEREKIPAGNNYKSTLQRLERKYGYTEDSIINVKFRFDNCFTRLDEISCHFHPKYDLAIVKFGNCGDILYKGHAVFARDYHELRPGNYFCRMGYPFPEFTCFAYNQERDDIEWTSEGKLSTPRFPLDGMMTRNLLDGNRIIGVELSTPGLRGQSGGPLFGKDGRVYGIQSATKHLHLGFDMNELKMVIGGRTQVVNNQPFLHVGHCIHADIIKEFLREHNVEYFEE